MAEAVRKLQLTGHGYKQAGSATLDIFFCLVQEQFNKKSCACSNQSSAVHQPTHQQWWHQAHPTQHDKGARHAVLSDHNGVKDTCTGRKAKPSQLITSECLSSACAGSSSNRMVSSGNSWAASLL
jgi:hypothetical protein